MPTRGGARRGREQERCRNVFPKKAQPGRRGNLLILESLRVGAHGPGAEAAGRGLFWEISTTRCAMGVGKTWEVYFRAKGRLCVGENIYPFPG